MREREVTGLLRGAVHGAAEEVVGVEDLRAAAVEDLVFGAGVVQEVVVAVEVVFGDVEAGGGCGGKAGRGFQLEAG